MASTVKNGNDRLRKGNRRRQRQWWLHLATKSVILSQEFQLIEILAIFSAIFFSCRVTWARVATHAIFAARWRRDNFKLV